MEFNRTPEGLSSLHIFLEVDLVVFVEGGKDSFSADDAAQLENYNGDTCDIRFWEEVFLTFIPDIKAEFRSLGGNAGVREIGLMVADGLMSNVLAATDRDFEEYFYAGSKLRGCLRTWGYSWENDVCTTQVLAEATYSYSGRSRAAFDAVAEANAVISAATKGLKRYVVLDYMLHAYDKSLLPREKPLKLIDGAANKQAPTLNITAAISSFRTASAGRCKFRSVNNAMNPWSALSIDRDCCGHFLMEIYYRALVHLLHKHSKGNRIDKDMGIFCLMREFFDQFRRGLLPHIYGHYNNQINTFRPLMRGWGLPV